MFARPVLTAALLAAWLTPGMAAAEAAVPMAAPAQASFAAASGPWAGLAADPAKAVAGALQADIAVDPETHTPADPDSPMALDLGFGLAAPAAWAGALAAPGAAAAARGAAAQRLPLPDMGQALLMALGAAGLVAGLLLRRRARC